MAKTKNKNKNKSKNKPTAQKALAHTNGGGAVTDDFSEEASESEGDEDTDEEYDEDENAAPAKGPMDNEAINRLFPKAMAAERAVEAANEVVKAKKRILTEAVTQLRVATGGSNGPFKVNGKRVQLRTRKGSAFLVWEKTVELPDFAISDDDMDSATE